MKLEKTSESVYGSSTERLNYAIEAKIKSMEQNGWTYKDSNGLIVSNGGGYVTILNFIRLPQEPIDE